MAITGKPKPPSPAPLPGPLPSEREVRNLIHKGGSVAEGTRASAASGIKPMLVQLRLYPDLVEEIDAVRKDTGTRKHRPPSRHAWIISAIEEKLERDKPKS